MREPIDLRDMLSRSETRQEAAVLVRAIATQRAALLVCYRDWTRLAIVARAERLAQQIERADDDGPWRDWLLDGYGESTDER